MGRLGPPEGTLQPNSKLDEEPSFVELFLRFVFVVFVYQKPLAVHSSKQPPGSQSIIISEGIAFLIGTY
jgi:hypothetical protein